MHEIFFRYAWIVFAVFFLFFTGCDKNAEPFTLDAAFKDIMGIDSQSPSERAKDAFDQENPDARRRAIENLMHNSWALREPYLKRFAQLTDPGVEKTPTVRAVAVRALGDANNRKYEPEIIAALEDPSPIVREDAARALEQMPTDKAVEQLRSLAINDESTGVRAAASSSLKHYQTDAVFRTLLRCLEDRNLNVRTAAHESLVIQTGQDMGMDPRSWSSGEVGSETLPEPRVRYRKRPWWDFMGVTGQTSDIDTGSEDSSKDRPWWDWFGITGD